MSDIFSSLGLSTRITVGISISTNNKIELACVDKASRSVIKYASKDLHYNNAIKEIVDDDELIITLQELFREVGLNPATCNAIFNLPNVHFAFSQLPLIVPDEQVSTTLLSDVEQQYLFKRNEPVISWNSVESVSSKSETRTIVYGAIQEKSVISIVQACQNMGIKLLAIETSYSAMIRGILYSGILDNEINATQTTNILFITSNNFAIFSLYGSKVIEYYEEPLAIKSFANDEVYIAIATAASAALGSYPAQNLLIVSETDEVSAELLAGRIRFDGKIKYLDRNKFTNKPFTSISYSILQTYLPYITLESVGAAVYNYENDGIKFNFLSDSDASSTKVMSINFGGKEIELNQAAIRIICIALIIVLSISAMVGTMSVNNSYKKLQTEVDSYEKQQSELMEQLSQNQDKAKVQTTDIDTIAQRIYAENKKEVALVNGLATEIPNEVWVEYFKANSSGEVTIQGKSTDSQRIYTFFKGLKRDNTDIYISRLKLDFDPLSPGGLGQNIFSYEIASTKNNKVTAPENVLEEAKMQNEAGVSPLPLLNMPVAPPPIGDIPPPISAP